MSSKSSTDLHWNERARTLADKSKVNIGDTTQREIENDFILRSLAIGQKVLEVGCGNGELTRVLREHAEWVDAFDYSEEMIASAKLWAGETNNRFFTDNILDLQMTDTYSAVVCVRVLINLRDLNEQKEAVDNLAKVTEPGGKVILIEGFQDGFDELTKLRQEVGLPAVQPAKINFYSRVADLLPQMRKHFEVDEAFHSGTYDFLTRVVYPLTVGANNVQEAGAFHTATLPLSKGFVPPDLARFGRLRGFILTKK